VHLFQGVLDRVRDLLQVHFANDVKAIFCHGIVRIC
jgi:hypothetical protein